MTRGFRILFLLTALVGRADEPADQLTTAGVAEFMAAYEAWDGARFGAAADLFRQAGARASKTVEPFYWLGAAEFHRMLQIQTLPVTRSNKVAAARAMDAALDALTRAVALDARHAESHALLGTIYGMKIDGNVLRALQLGPRVQKHRSQALEHGPDNPRVRYLLGVCQFHTAKKPAALREALASLELAERLFEAESARAAGPREPRWGHSSCLTFLGRTHELLGERKQAASYFRKALTRQPSDHLAQEGLARVAGGEGGEP